MSNDLSPEDKVTRWAFIRRLVSTLESESESKDKRIAELEIDLKATEAQNERFAAALVATETGDSDGLNSPAYLREMANEMARRVDEVGKKATAFYMALYNLRNAGLDVQVPESQLVGEEGPRINVLGRIKDIRLFNQRMDEASAVIGYNFEQPPPPPEKRPLRGIPALLQECREFFANCPTYDGAETNNLDTRLMDAIAEMTGLEPSGDQT